MLLAWHSRGIPAKPVPHHNAAIKKDYAWLDNAVTKHYRGYGSDVLTKPHLDVPEDGLVKPLSIWSYIGRRPIFCAGNSNGDIQMLQYTKSNTHPSLCLLVNHDDGNREFDYTAGAEDALKMANERGWVVISMKEDWSSVFAAEE